ncbi:MAG: hypothetical protein MJE68_00080 [Proteobacteria bacterium]|nr:hypothetical protein [Pseudomonadota bacterium]
MVTQQQQADTLFAAIFEFWRERERDSEGGGGESKGGVECLSQIQRYARQSEGVEFVYPLPLPEY